MGKHTKSGTFPHNMADLYQTPENNARDVIARLGLSGVFWEPFAGDGNICRQLVAAGHKVLAYDIFQYDYPLDRVVDFWELKEFPKFDHIITNPPYGIRNNLIAKIIEKLLANRPIFGVIALLLPADFDCGSTRMPLFKGCPYYRGQIKLTDRIIWIPGTDNGGKTNFIWHIWGPTNFDWRPQERSPIVDYMRGKDVA